ncbi:MAG: LysM peptidoglycan-binding domain-containing protein, partial [Anaerolineae bacterium]
ELRPGDAHLPRTTTATIGAGGLDLGLVLMPATGPPTLVVPEYGGIVGGCTNGATRVAFATDVLAAAAPVRVTCIDRPDLLPAPPPVGQLPLGLVDLRPWDVALSRPAVLTVALPPQPRYGAGVALDLLRLDARAMTWSAAGSLIVEAGGRTASGEVADLGSYLVASPPLGALGDAPGGAAAVGAYYTAPRPGDPARSRFEPATPVVYLHFEYGAMDNTTVTVRTTDSTGALMFRGSRPYSGAGADDVPMAVPGGWPPGRYSTTVQVGGDSSLAEIDWSVAQAPAAAQGPTPGASPGTRAIAPRVVRCSPPGGWYPYRVVAGDTLYALALKFALTVAALRDANCLTGDTIYVGQHLYLPRPLPPPRQWPPAPPPAPPPPFPPPPGGPKPMPTTWYTPPASTPGPPTPRITAGPPGTGATSSPPPAPSSEPPGAEATPSLEPTLAPRPTPPPMPLGLAQAGTGRAEGPPWPHAQTRLPSSYVVPT